MILTTISSKHHNFHHVVSQVETLKRASHHVNTAVRQTKIPAKATPRQPHVDRTVAPCGIIHATTSCHSDCVMILHGDIVGNNSQNEQEHYVEADLTGLAALSPRHAYATIENSRNTPNYIRWKGATGCCES